MDEPGCDGRVLFIGGGPRCQTTYRELLTASFAARGLPMLPDAAFPTEPPFIGDWLDTAESEALLGYQRVGLHEWIEGSQRPAAPVRWATRLVAPLVQSWMLSHSPRWGRR